MLYYGRAIDYTILPALNQIGSQQAQPTIKIKDKIQRLLDYVNTYKNAKVRFYASDMQLLVDSDASFLVLPKAKSRVAGYFRLANTSEADITHTNGAILIECKAIRNVVTSAAEAETHAIFHNARTSIPLRYLLIEMGHTQQPVPIKTDKSTTSAFVNNIYR